MLATSLYRRSKTYVRSDHVEYRFSPTITRN